jgi:hypothetical protein
MAQQARSLGTFLLQCGERVRNQAFREPRNDRPHDKLWLTEVAPEPSDGATSLTVPRNCVSTPLPDTVGMIGRTGPLTKPAAKME